MKLFAILSILVIIVQPVSAVDLSDAAGTYHTDLEENTGLEENNSNLKDEIEVWGADIENLDASISELNVKINATSGNITLVKQKINSIDANIAHQNDEKDGLERQSGNIFGILGGIPSFLIGLWIAIAVFLVWKRD
ncbi:MAG: hypothetical protein A7316_07555 [Candidatus Altiarchaeales archaeon WOR_SM1_86-2]|nr:MAG: hypothetical protein A7316_07555 [Candidatus Altiarchaeales archaeon WOR_SM1_86-2]